VVSSLPSFEGEAQLLIRLGTSHRPAPPRAARRKKVLNEDFYRPESLKTEGFIHLSTQEQVLETAARFYAQEREMIVLAVPERRVKAKLKCEDVPDHGRFPHLYAPLDLADIETTHLIEQRPDGQWVWVQ
jgi:uncharacterized protein (DUF952 family)